MLRDEAAETRITTPLALEVSRISLEYVRDNILISRGDGDLIDAFIFTTALDANMTPVDRAPDLSVMYGDADNSAPDDLRRPVTMHAVAQSLGLPVETVRRRFAGLVKAGVCQATPRGIIVPREAVTSSAYKAIQRARYERARQFHRTLKALDILPAAGRVEPAPQEPLVRAANRVMSEYVLRACRNLLALTGDVLTSLVLVQLALENTGGMGGEALMRWVRTPAVESLPIRIVGLAEGLPYSGETVRRHINRLKDLGFCGRVAGGLVAVPAPGSVPRLVDLARGNLGDLRRLFTRLANLGVLAEWDDDNASR